MKNRSIFTNLFSIFFVIIVISIGTSAIYSITTFKNYIFQIEKDELIEKTDILYSLFPDITLKDIEGINSFTNSALDKSTRITVINRLGVVISDSVTDSETMDNHLHRPEIQRNLEGESEVFSRFSNTLKENMIYYSIPINNNGEINGFLRTSISVESIEKRVRIVTLTISIISIILVLLAIGLCYIIAINFSTTINSIKRVAGCYAVGDFNNSLAEKGPMEIVLLSRSINSMGRFLQERIMTIVKQKNRYKSMLESMREPVIRVNNNLIIEEINNSGEKLFNIVSQNIIGKELSDISDNREFLDFVKKSMSGKSSQESIIRFIIDKEYNIQVNSSILYDADKKKLGLLLVLNDLTDRVRLEEMRKEFVANVSHELRTPTTAIQGYIETLLNNDLNKEQMQTFLETVYRHSIRLNSIIDDLLMLAGLEKKESSFIMEDFPVTDLLSSIINVVSIKADESNIKLIVNSSENHNIYAHPILAEQAITNIITNSIKYSYNGSDVCINTFQDTSGLTVEVVDKGCGIPKENQELIFERFYRVDKARSRDKGGTGLGLSIVKKVMDIHGGTASLVSEINKGTTFKLFFPNKRSH